mmetsp:Transcript_2664/g.6763  ORF Transcript_2664/g.6763 Transcript_2664/m.6763 type:complete len:93 (-) Transcript_2664:241-519(-)
MTSSTSMETMITSFHTWEKEKMEREGTLPVSLGATDDAWQYLMGGLQGIDDQMCGSSALLYAAFLEGNMTIQALFHGHPWSFDHVNGIDFFA